MRKDLSELAEQKKSVDEQLKLALADLKASQAKVRRYENCKDGKIGKEIAKQSQKQLDKVLKQAELDRDSKLVLEQKIEELVNEMEKS